MLDVDLPTAPPGAATTPPGRRDLARAAVTRVAYPLLLAAVVTTVVLVQRFDVEPGPASFLFMLATATYLAVLEQVAPYQRDWQPTRREWRWYAVYFLLTTTAGGLAQLPVLAVVDAVAEPRSALPVVAELPLALLVASLGSYVVHRLGHTNRWLWRLHGVHHAPEKVNVANNTVNHVLDVLLAQATVQLSLALLGFSEQAVFTVGIFIIAQGYFTHANVDVRIGWLNYVLASPEQHRLHHSRDLREAGHYGADIPLWDLVFGTFTWRQGRRPAAVGLADPGSFPPIESVVATLLHPWRGPRA